MTRTPRVAGNQDDLAISAGAPDNRSLIDRIRIGDAAAFEELYHLFWTALCNFAFRYVQSAEEAEDVVQEVLFRVWRTRADWNVAGSLQNYLFIAVRNEALQRLRRDAAARQWREQASLNNSNQDDEAAAEFLAKAEANAEIERALSEMPAKRRAVCALRWIDGLSYAQIAERLGIQEKTVENHLGAGVKFLRERLSSKRL